MRDGEQVSAEPAAAAAAVGAEPAPERPAGPSGAAGNGRAGYRRERRNVWPMSERSDDLPVGARLVTMLDMIGGSSPSS